MNLFLGAMDITLHRWMQTPQQESDLPPPRDADGPSVMPPPMADVAPRSHVDVARKPLFRA